MDRDQNGMDYVRITQKKTILKDILLKTCLTILLFFCLLQHAHNHEVEQNVSQRIPEPLFETNLSYDPLNHS